MSKTVKIEYIGRQINRPDDTALRTRRVWEGFGSVVEVPADEAAHYLAHPLEWRAISHEESEQRRQARIVVAENFERIKDELGPMTVTDLEELRTEIGELIAQKRRQAEREALNPPPVPTGVPDAAAGVDSDDKATADAAATRLRAIRKVIEELDPKDDDHYSTRGPRVPVVSERFGAPVTAAEIAAALAIGTGE